MWDHAKKLDSPTVRMKEMACCHWRMVKNIDPLGIKKFIKSEKEVEREHKDHEYEENE